MHAVVFDIDGTLLQSAAVDDDLYRAAVRQILGNVAFRTTLAEYDFVTDSGILQQIFQDNGIPGEEATVAAVKARFVELIDAYIRVNGPFPEVPGAFRHLERYRHSPQHFVAIATGGWRQTARLKLETAGFSLTGLPLASSDDAYERVDIMKKALTRPESEFTSITYYGDGSWDKIACEALGWRFIAVGPSLGGIASYAELAP